MASPKQTKVLYVELLWSFVVSRIHSGQGKVPGVCGQEIASGARHCLASSDQRTEFLHLHRAKHGKYYKGKRTDRSGAGRSLAPVASLFGW